MKREKCANARMLVYKESHCGLVFGEHFNFFFYVCVSKSVMSINGLSFTSARPTPQPCVSSSVWGIRELLQIIVLFVRGYITKVSLVTKP